jgi:PAS domain S-box-containing protein
MNSDLENVKSKLVDLSLIIAAIAGFFLLLVSAIRYSNYNRFDYVMIQGSVYGIILLVTLLRRKLNYFIRSFSIILLLYVLAFIDFRTSGILSLGIMWLTAGVIFTALYYDFKKALIALAIAVIMPLSEFLLHGNGFSSYLVSFEEQCTSPLTLLMRILNLLLISLMVILTIRHIHTNMQKNIDLLQKKNAELEESSKVIKMEIKTRRKSELLAINNEKNFRNIFDCSSDSIMIVDEEGLIVDFNAAFLNLTGFTESEVVNMSFRKLLTEDDAESLASYKHRLHEIPPRFDIKYELKNKEIRYIDCSASIIYYNEKDHVMIVSRDYTNKINQERINYLTAIAAEEKERARFSKELHDGLGPLLSTLKIYLEVLYIDPNDVEIRNRINNTLTDSIKSVKEISNNLSPYVLENLGLVKAIGSFVERIRYSRKLQISFDSNLETRLMPEVEISIYRFITELINNTIKHANATEIRVAMYHEGTLLYIEYHDNGVGINVSDAHSRSKGIGLFNLQSRIENMGGKFQIVSAPGKGFSVYASVLTNDKLYQHEQN